MSGELQRILVAGLGNVFLGDDAFGVEVARYLLEHPPPGNVRIVDFGIRGIDLVYALLDGYDLVILVDAVSRGGQPGTIYLIEPEVPTDSACGQTTSVMLDPHDMAPAKVLRLVSSLGGRVGRLLLVGCEPAPMDEAADGGGSLSEPVRNAVDRAIGLIRQLLADAPGDGVGPASGYGESESAAVMPQAPTAGCGERSSVP